jgi:hypothetical protein
MLKTATCRCLGLAWTGPLDRLFTANQQVNLTRQCFAHTIGKPPSKE